MKDILDYLYLEEPSFGQMNIFFMFAQDKCLSFNDLFDQVSLE